MSPTRRDSVLDDDDDGGGGGVVVDDETANGDVDDAVGAVVDDETANGVAGGTVLAAELAISTVSPLHTAAALELGYGRRFARLLVSCPAVFGAVTRLSLTVMRLRSFDAVLAACTKLESLRLYACDPTGRAGGVWRVRHPRLAELRLMLCAFLVVKLEWLPRLESFAYKDWATVETSRNPVVFGHVPRLLALKLFNIVDDGQQTLRLSRTLRNTAVRHLGLGFLGCDIWVEPEDPKKFPGVFRNLKRLKISNIHHKYGLTWTMFLLQAAPLLEELLVKLWCNNDGDPNILPAEKEIQWEVASSFEHCNLTRLTIIWGFHSNEEERLIAYICRLLQAAVHLQEVSIVRRSKKSRHNAPSCCCIGSPISDQVEEELLRKRIVDGRSSTTPIKICIQS